MGALKAFSISAILLLSYSGFATPSLDLTIRSALKAHTENGLQAASITSDVLLYSLAPAPFLLDAFALTWWRDSNRPQALRMLWIDAIAMSSTLLTTTAAKYSVHRARPYTIECTSSSPPSNCSSKGANRSFWSGHTSTAFTSASMICGHALTLEIFGSTRAAKVLGCSIPLTLATTTGLLRIVADRHYFTDVLTGAVVGGLFGALIPHLIGERITVSLDLGPSPQVSFQMLF